MGDYVIWCAEKIQAVSGWCWDKCMAIVTSDKYGYLFENELSVSNYLKEVSNGNL